MKLLLIIVLFISGALGANQTDAGNGQKIEVSEGMEVLQPLVSEAPPVAAAVLSIEGEAADEPKAEPKAELKADQLKAELKADQPKAEPLAEEAKAELKADQPKAEPQTEEVKAKPSPSASGGCEDKPISVFHHVGGVSLYDTPQSVTSKLGEPEKIEQDEFWQELDIYYYPDVHVAFYDGQVQYVDVPLAEQIEINGKSVPMTEEGLKASLGQPDFIAEDGIVFQRDEAVLKLFIDESTRKPLYASFYHIATV